MKFLHLIATALVCCLCLNTAKSQCNSLQLIFVDTIPAKCFGTATGGVLTSVSGAQPPISYLLDGVLPFTSGNILNSIPAGTHDLQVIDGNGCRDTIFFRIRQPNAIDIQTSQIDATCNGANDGSASAIATGGSGGFSYEWQACNGGNVLQGQSITDLYAGCYRVYIEDQNDCENTADVFIGESPAFAIVETRDSVSCFNGDDGAITLAVSGGVAPYSYLWDVGQTTATATDLEAGFHPVTITDDTGCSNVYLAEAFEPLRLNIDSVPRVSPFCFGGTDGSATVFASGGTPPYMYDWTGGTTNGNMVTDLGNGSYMVTVTDAKACTDAYTFNIFAQQQVNVNVTSISHESCLGACDGSATLTASGGNAPYTFQWADPSLPQPDPTALCAGTYVVTVSDANNCTTERSVTINPGNAPQISFIETNPSCPSALDGRIITNISGAVSPVSYVWNSGQNTQNLQNIDCGAYTLTATDGTGCSASESVTLICPPAIQIDSISITLLDCFGDANGGLEVHAQGGAGTLNYLWSDMNAQNQAAAVNLTAGTYTVTVSDANGCSITAAETLNTPVELTAFLSTVDVKCFGESTGEVSITANGGTGTLDFLWSVGGTSQTLTNQTAGAYIATVTDANGCTTETMQVSINEPGAPLQVTATQTKEACVGQSDAIAGAFTTGGTGTAIEYLWSNGETTSIATGLPSGQVTVTVTDENGCMENTMLTITEYDSIKVNVAFNSPSCFGRTDGSAAVNSVSGGSGTGNPSDYVYAWSLAGSGNTDFIQNLSAGGYELTVTDNAGCSASFDLTLLEPDPISFDLSVDSVRCAGEDNGQVIVNQVLSTAAIQSYTWSTGTTTDTLSNIGSGDYTLTVMDANDCPGDTTVTVSEPSKIEVQEFFVDGIKCNNDSTGVVVASVIGGSMPYSYQWSSGETTPSLTDKKAGQYKVQIIDARGCVIEDSVMLSNPNPLDIALNIDDIACAGDQNGRVAIQLNSGDGPFSYSIDGENFGGSSVFVGLEAGTHVVTVRDGEGCLSQDTAFLSEPDSILVDLGTDLTLRLGDSLNLSASIQNAQGILLYNWFSSNGPDFKCTDLDCAGISVKPKFDNVYSLVVEDENGCRGESIVRVLVEKQRGAFVPTGFTPNGDQNNDMLCIYGKKQDIKTVHSFRVYDRWGELVYESLNTTVNDELTGWDGTHRGKESMAGVYVWYLDVEYVDGYHEVLSGKSHLIR